MIARGTARRQTSPAAAALLLLAAAAGCTPLARPELAEPRPETLAAVRGLVAHPCNRTTAAALDGFGVPPDDLRSIYYDERVTGSGRGTLQGYDAWVGLRRGPGELVIRHQPTCAFMTSYTQGGLRVGPDAGGG